MDTPSGIAHVAGAPSGTSTAAGRIPEMVQLQPIPEGGASPPIPEGGPPPLIPERGPSPPIPDGGPVPLLPEGGPPPPILEGGPSPLIPEAELEALVDDITQSTNGFSAADLLALKRQVRLPPTQQQQVITKSQSIGRERMV